jgi:hypothetical protein
MLEAKPLKTEIKYTFETWGCEHLRAGLISTPNLLYLTMTEQVSNHKKNRKMMLHVLKFVPVMTKKTNFVVWVRERTIPNERQPLVGEVSANFHRRYHIASITDPYGSILGLLHRSRYFFFQVAPELYSRGWVDLVPDPLLLTKSGSAGNRIRTSGSVARNSDH